MKIGFSTSILQSIRDIDQLVKDKQPAIVEICNCPADDLPALKDYLKNVDFEFGLHCPLPYSGWMSHFDISGPNLARQEESFQLVLNTFETAHQVGASYVLAHFPTVFLDMEGYQKQITSPEAHWEQIVQAAARLEQLSIENDIPVLLENVGPNPYFFKSNHFIAIFEQFPHLKMCLDMGHHYVLPSEEDIYEFVEKVAPYVVSTHVYNTSLKSYRVGYHAAPFQSLSPAEGWMDLPRLIGILLDKAPLRYFLFEYTFDKEKEVRNEDLQWIVDLLSKPTSQYG